MIRAAALFLALGVATFAFADAPDLIVVISVDQLRFDYVDRFAPWFTTRGFKRFTTEGATFPSARFRYGATFTGPGHTAIGAGLVPAESGITGNSWFERDAPVDAHAWEWYFDDITPYRAAHITATPFDASGEWWWKAGGSPRYCTYDDTVQVTAGKTTGMSPLALDGEALGDRIKAAHPHARAIGVAMKDRASILMAGRRADAVYWFDHRTPGFISSTYYRFNPAVLSFNALIPGYLPATARWMPSPYIPPDEMQRATFDPPAAWPLKNTTYGGTFPHPVTSVRALTYTPFAHQMLLDFAHHVIATENLGRTRGTPDLLFVGISSTDYLGHYYGPDSMEVADSMARLDRSLADFLDMLERRFGNRVLVALTSDHGVQPNPEIVKLRDPHGCGPHRRPHSRPARAENLRPSADAHRDRTPSRPTPRRAVQRRCAALRCIRLLFRRARVLAQLAARRRTRPRSRTRQTRAPRHHAVDDPSRHRRRVDQHRVPFAQRRRVEGRTTDARLLPPRPLRRRADGAAPRLDLDVGLEQHHPRTARRERHARAADVLGLRSPRRCLRRRSFAAGSRAHARRGGGSGGGRKDVEAAAVHQPMTDSPSSS
jgi:hypothetical protein